MPAIELSVESRDVGAKTGANAEEWLDVDESRYTCGFSCSGSGGVFFWPQKSKSESAFFTQMVCTLTRAAQRRMTRKCTATYDTLALALAKYLPTVGTRSQRLPQMPTKAVTLVALAAAAVAVFFWPPKSKSESAETASQESVRRAAARASARMQEADAVISDMHGVLPIYGPHLPYGQSDEEWAPLYSVGMGGTALGQHFGGDVGSPAWTVDDGPGVGVFQGQGMGSVGLQGTNSLHQDNQPAPTADIGHAIGASRRR